MKIALFCCILIFAVEYINGAPFFDSNTPIHTEIVDPNNRTIWAMFNLTDDQLNRVREQIKKKPNKTQEPPDLNEIKNFRMNELRYRLETALRAGSSESQESQEHPLHEMAAYPVCTSESNEATWQNDNNVTIRFSNSLFELSQNNLNLDSAILRLYKYNPNYTDEPQQQNNGAEETNGDHNNNKPRRCNNPMLDSQIRVTVSFVRRNKRERKKQICNTIMMDVSKTGWVEIDIKHAIYVWEDVVKRTQNSHHSSILVGWLMIEVHDEEERPLKPGKYFEPPKCDQAGIAIPWNFYNGPRTALSAFKANDVPKYPRLDVKLIGYGAFAPRIENRELHEQLRENLRRQLNDDYPPQTTNAELENETTLSTSDANLLNAPTDSEFSMQTPEQKQHFRRLHYQKEDSIEPQNEKESEICSNQHIHRHRRQHNGHHQHHHHHHRHLNHNHAHHHHIQQEQQQQQP